MQTGFDALKVDKISLRLESSDSRKELTIGQVSLSRKEVRPGDTLEFGTHYGRQVEFEYEVGLASSHDVESVLASLQPPVTGSSLLPVAELIKIDGGIRGVLKVSKDRYEAWKAGVVAAQSDLPAVAVSSNR